MTEPVKNAYVWVVGGRSYTDKGRVFRVLDTYHQKYGIRRIVTGAASGADHWGELWAVENDIPYVGIPARWINEGLSAGPQRNERIAAEEKPDTQIAFPGGPGTKNAIEVAKRHDIIIFEISP